MDERGNIPQPREVGEKITFRWFGLVAVCFSLCAAGMQAVETGMARVNVLQELGQPVSAIGRGDTEVLSYPGGVRITLKAGRVTEMKGLKPAEATAATAPPEPEPEKEPALTKAQIAEQDRLEKKLADADANARAEMEKSIMEMENAHSQPANPLLPPPFKAGNFIFGLALKMFLTLAALKLACKYWGAEIFWSGLLAVSLVDVLVRGVIGLIGFKLLHMVSLFYADEAAAAFIMVLILRKVSINQSLGQAVQLTMTTKTFTVVVGSFLVTIALRMLF